MLDAEVEVLEVDVEVRKDELLFDQRPDHPRHLIAIELDDGRAHLNVWHRVNLRPSGCRTGARRLGRISRAEGIVVGRWSLGDL